MSSVNTIPANRRRAINDVVAIIFLPKTGIKLSLSGFTPLMI